MKRILALLVALLVPALVAACGNDDPSDAGSGGQVNGADVQFATGMIPHHAQALQMVDLTAGGGLSTEAQSIADDIEAAQDPEIQQMSAWLEAWNEPVPSLGRHDMNSMDMPGMATMGDMAPLQAARGKDLDHLFLTMMIEHHSGAIEMAEAELADGENAHAKQLAQDIIDGQQQEIDAMTQLLNAT